MDGLSFEAFARTFVEEEPLSGDEKALADLRDMRLTAAIDTAAP
jgi:hypothetical protein